MNRTANFILCSVFVMACGATPKPPIEQMSKAKAVVRAASEMGAQQDAPKAALHLKMARDQIMEAELLIQREQMNSAKYVLMRAEADAELSIAFAKAAQKREEAEQAFNKVQKLKKEVN